MQAMEKAVAFLKDGLPYIIEIPHNPYEIEDKLLFTLYDREIVVEFEKVSRKGYLFYKEVEQEKSAKKRGLWNAR